MIEKIAKIASALEKALEEQKKAQNNNASAGKRFRKHLRQIHDLLEEMRKESLEWKK